MAMIAANVKSIEEAVEHVQTAPRGRPGEHGPELPVEIAFLDPEEQTLPILISKAA